jgi:hypothetical protein
MTTDRPVVEPAAPEDSLPGAVELAFSEVEAPSGPGERLRRLRRRRRLWREELLAVLALLLVLAVTVAVLATQWLSSGASTHALSHLLSGGAS